MPEGQIRAVSS